MSAWTQCGQLFQEEQMASSRTRFILWLLAGNLLLIAGMLSFGLLMYGPTEPDRLYAIGRHTGSALFFGNMAALLLRLAFHLRKKR